MLFEVNIRNNSYTVCASERALLKDVLAYFSDTPSYKTIRNKYGCELDHDLMLVMCLDNGETLWIFDEDELWQFSFNIGGFSFVVLLAPYKQIDDLFREAKRVFNSLYKIERWNDVRSIFHCREDDHFWYVKKWNVRSMSSSTVFNILNNKDIIYCLCQEYDIQLTLLAFIPDRKQHQYDQLRRALQVIETRMVDLLSWNDLTWNWLSFHSKVESGGFYVKIKESCRSITDGLVDIASMTKDINNDPGYSSGVSSISHRGKVYLDSKRLVSEYPDSNFFMIADDKSKLLQCQSPTIISSPKLNDADAVSAAELLIVPDDTDDQSDKMPSFSNASSEKMPSFSNASSDKMPSFSTASYSDEMPGFSNASSSLERNAISPSEHETSFDSRNVLEASCTSKRTLKKKKKMTKHCTGATMTKHCGGTRIKSKEFKDDYRTKILIKHKFFPRRRTSRLTGRVLGNSKRLFNHCLIPSFLSKNDMDTLKPGCWLNDQIINCYLKQVTSCSRSKSVYAFNTFFYTCLKRRGYLGVHRWTRKVDIFQNDLVMFPIHLGNHWTLVVANVSKKVITYFNSIERLPNSGCQKVISDYLNQECMTKHKNAHNWSLETCQDNPTQLNKDDCGVFVCLYAKCLTLHIPMNFTQANIRMARKLITKEICLGKIFSKIF